ncbi:MAG: substrate-binding domain-containing protein [Hyphomicrobiaceae bacterium]|nr:substrate-binding domain-containing protein [Hyphomicrobiaceae bacterium]MCC0025236.1 LacI family DNA-binding transcriptional regulator [Hyphomicrobiaceae bacterium]
MSRIAQKRQNTSIAELARHCGLAEGTISRALNNYPDIALKTRERVQQAARELGYRPSSTARRLARGVVETVGFVLPGRKDHLSDPFLSEILDGLAAELSANDWDLLLAAVPDDHDEIDVMDRLLRAGKVGGFAVTRVRRKDPRIEYLRNAAIPFVAYGRTEKHNDYSWLDIDNEKAFVDAVAYLADLGHRRIALLGGDLQMNYAWLRRQGFIKGLQAKGLEVRDDYVIDNVRVDLGAREAVERLLALDEPPTALVCITDSVAIGAMHALQRAGLKPGRDVSIIGYDGLPIGTVMEPALTTMSQATYEAGRQIARMLLKQTASQNSEISQVLWEAKLTPRASAYPPAG